MVSFVALITIAQAILNHFGIKLTAMMTDISGYIILVTTAVLILACLLLGSFAGFLAPLDLHQLFR